MTRDQFSNCKETENGIIRFWGISKKYVYAIMRKIKAPQDVDVLAVLDLWVPRSRFIVVASNLVFWSFKMPHLILPPVPPL